jgi:hypothetical protein
VPWARCGRHNGRASAVLAGRKEPNPPTATASNDKFRRGLLAAAGADHAKQKADPERN